MTVKELEARVVALEHEVRQLRHELAAKGNGGQKNWRAAIDQFAGDEGLLAIFKDAQKLREADRKRTKRQTVSRRKSRS